MVGTRSLISESTDIRQWMAANKLKLNDDKTEVLLVKTKQRKIPDTAPQNLRIGNANISFSKSARNLGVTITSDLSMDDHVNSICRSAYFELRRISTIRLFCLLKQPKL